ncbi:MAG: sigma-70 family RNA polymerase sigma factor [Acidobacteria bacterium]|nr:sigma-70 family RNA polymerase sigma factor [Acidobacteriota bacterium]
MRSRNRIIEELLVLATQSGRAEAFARLAELWHPRMMRYALRLTSDREGAREAVQDAWMAVARGLMRLQDPACFAPWALCIVRSRCADWIRRRQCLRRENTGLDAAAPLAATAEPRGDNRYRLRRAVRGLDPEPQALVEMFYLESLTVAEIARILEIPAGTVKSRLYHVRERLRAILEV